jgi:hypothetical protein
MARLYRKVVLNTHMEQGLGLRELERMGVRNKEETALRDSYASNMEQFLNRVMVLPVEQQNHFFELFYERYLAAVEAAKRAGAFDFAVGEIRARNLRSVAAPQTLFVGPTGGSSRRHGSPAMRWWRSCLTACRRTARSWKATASRRRSSATSDAGSLSGLTRRPWCRIRSRNEDRSVIGRLTGNRRNAASTR